MFSFPREKLGPKNRFMPKNMSLFFLRNSENRNDLIRKKHGAVRSLVFPIHEKNGNAKKQGEVFKDSLVAKDT